MVAPGLIAIRQARRYGRKAGEINVIGTGMPLSKIGYAPIRGTKTLKDIGIDLEIGITHGIYLPKGTPSAIVAKLTQIVEKAFGDPGHRFTTPVHLNSRLRASRGGRWGQVIRSRWLNLKSNFLSLHWPAGSGLRNGNKGADQ